MKMMLKPVITKGGSFVEVVEGDENSNLKIEYCCVLWEIGKKRAISEEETCWIRT